MCQSCRYSAFPFCDISNMEFFCNPVISSLPNFDGFAFNPFRDIGILDKDDDDPVKLDSTSRCIAITF